MSNKNEDLEMSRMEEKQFGERESFLLKPAPHHRARVDGGMGSTLSQIENNPGAAVLAYCFSSISMTVVNKYVVSGSSWNLNFLYLAIQVCAATLWHHAADTYSIGRYLHGCNSGLKADGFDP
jgi:GDP-mannose transporter